MVSFPTRGLNKRKQVREKHWYAATVPPSVISSAASTVTLQRQLASGAGTHQHPERTDHPRPLSDFDPFAVVCASQLHHALILSIHPISTRAPRLRRLQFRWANQQRNFRGPILSPEIRAHPSCLVPVACAARNTTTCPSLCFSTPPTDARVRSRLNQGSEARF